ncbi:SMI1/KNR4 family protein [Streptacidiphilus sp. 4-A2]|nr:SMI1/KNR4 family protein [Streptacidiphilus sp. 4-A2]
MTAVHAAGFDYHDSGVDYEPFPEFLSAEETTDWLRAWTGNGELTGDGFRVFGQDGTGGCTAFWLVRPDRPLTDQPVVFLGSEGELAVVASDLGRYLWLLADGFGPRAAVDHQPDGHQPASHQPASQQPASQQPTSQQRVAPGAVDPAGPAGRSRPELVAIAERHAPGGRRPAAAVLAEAAGEFPHFGRTIEALCN